MGRHERTVARFMPVIFGESCMRMAPSSISTTTSLLMAAYRQVGADPSLP